MQLPTVLAVLLIVSGLWSLVAWPLVARRVARSAGDTPTATATPRSGEDGAPVPRPAAIPLIVVAISMTLAAATLVVGFRTL